MKKLATLFIAVSLFSNTAAKNIIKNPGFEKIDASWTTATSSNGVAIINYNINPHSGNFCGYTKSWGSGDSTSASLIQELAPIQASDLNQKNNLAWWWKVGFPYLPGEQWPYYFHVKISSLRGKNLYYGYVNSVFMLPPDTDVNKYILVTNVHDTTDWTLTVRSFYQDWTSKGLSSTDSINKIELYSYGEFGFWGQYVQWDDLYLGGESSNVEEKVQYKPSDFEIWPKISNGSVHYQSDNPFSVFDAAGRQLFRREGAGALSLPGAGVYFFKQTDRTIKIVVSP